MPQVTIIGAGVAGLAAAIRTAASGHAVTVIESAPEPGGKLREIRQDGYRFDVGPSLFTWPELVMELDSLTRQKAAQPERLPPAFAYQKLDRSTHYFWEDGTQLTAWSEPARFAEACSNTFGVSASVVIEHLVHSTKSFHATRGIFLEQSLHEWSATPRSAWGEAAKFAHRLPWFGTLHRWNRRRLKEPHLVQLFDRYATYNGSDPHRAPAMMHVIPHLEHGHGTFFPESGMVGIARHLHALAAALGVEFLFEHTAQRIEHSNGKITGVTASSMTDGSLFIPSNTVISNADIWPTFRRLLPDLPAPEKILQQERSTSGVIFYWGVRGVRSELHLHNILFSEDYAAEFGSIRETGHPGDDPTVYIHISSKLKPDDAPPESENWFVMVNVEAAPDKIDALIPDIRQRVMRKIERTLGFNPEPLIETEFHFAPSTIEQRTSSHLGALYGASSNSPVAAFLRHRNRSTQLEGLYFCGGSVHPGGGIPLCLLSARITTDLIQQHA